MLSLKNLSVTIADKEVLKDISLDFDLGKNYCIIGQNGSGKSSLAMTIMWNPKYSIESWVLSIEKKNINKLAPNERARLGIFLAFQHIPEIKWVKVFEFLRSIYDAQKGTTTSFIQFKKIIEPLIEELSIDKEFLRRDVNVGFSWWERRKLEVLQIRLLEPKYIFLDEIDSGLDIDAFHQVAGLLQKLDNKKNCIIVITHHFTILDYIKIDKAYLLEKGIIKATGDKKLIEEIKKEWFK